MSGTRHNIPCLNEGLSRWLLVLWPASWLLRSLSLPSWSNHGVKTLLELVLLSGSVSRGFCLICVVNGSETTINDLLESCGLAMGLNLSLKEVNQFFFILSFFLLLIEGRGGVGWRLAVETDTLRKISTKHSFYSRCFVGTLWHFVAAKTSNGEAELRVESFFQSSIQK